MPVPDLRYRLAASEFPALADLPGEGHGVLIAPQWVVTAGHAVSWQHSVDVVVVGGAPRAVNRVVIHPGYKKAPQKMIDAAMKSGDWATFFDFITSSDDIALIQLDEPVHDVVPARIYNGSVLGKVIQIGKGATGTGSEGHHLHGPNRTDLRHGYNEITVSEGRWIGYTFDKPPNALPLEAKSGSGDSGGPILVAVDTEWHVAGITAWKRAQVRGTELCPGRRPVTVCSWAITPTGSKRLWRQSVLLGRRVEFRQSTLFQSCSLNTLGSMACGNYPQISAAGYFIRHRIFPDN